MVVPSALRVIRLKPGRRVIILNLVIDNLIIAIFSLIIKTVLCFVLLQFCVLGRLSHEVGWKYQVCHNKEQTTNFTVILKSVTSVTLFLPGRD